MTRYALGISYCGSDWHGWQSQPGRQTVQDQLEAALSAFAAAPIRVVCAGRTDAGVHAVGQVVHFESAAERVLQGWVRGVNALLPRSIAVTWALVVDEEFHARFSARQRRYDYLLYNHAVRSPHWHHRAGWTHAPLDLALMQQAAACLIGTHDFSAFRSAECQAKSPVRHMVSLDIVQQGPMFVFTLRANAFLHHMVRNLIGSLVAVGNGKQSVAWLDAVLAARDRSRAAPTFMADGLYLTAVQYPDGFGLPEPPGFDAVFPGLMVP